MTHETKSVVPHAHELRRRMAYCYVEAAELIWRLCKYWYRASVRHEKVEWSWGKLRDVTIHILGTIVLLALALCIYFFPVQTLSIAIALYVMLALALLFRTTFRA